MRSDGTRRRGWNYDAPPIPKSTRSEMHDRDARRSPPTRHLAAGLLTIFIAMLIIVACVVAFRAIDFKRISVPAALKRIYNSIPFHKFSPSSEMTALPALHDSPVQNVTIASSVPTRNLQAWRTVCAGNGPLLLKSFGPSVLAIRRIRRLSAVPLVGTVSWLEKHPNGEAPWINPKNFDAAIMALCQKDPKSLPLCLKP